jgi:hypothetical protein
MNRLTWSLLLLIFTVSIGYGQDKAVPKDINGTFTEPVAAATPEKKPAKFLKNPNSETEKFIVFLNSTYKDGTPRFSDFDKKYIRGFTTYAVPEDLRPDVVLQLSFILHSLVGISDQEENAGGYYPIAQAVYSEVDPETKKPTKPWDRKSIVYHRQVPGSDTLYWIDIREFNWSIKSMEAVANFDAYFAKPIVSEENNGLLRLLAGNALLRADWFVFHAARTVEQTDIDSKVKPIYRELLYSLTKEPKTVPEFRATWGLPDVEKSRKLGNEFGALVSKSKDVARHNRLVFGYNNELGWLYQSYDVKAEVGLKDYVESFPKFAGKPPPPGAYDGGEIFATNQLKLQVYDLYDAKENLADFADATIVRHLSDVLGDARVVTPHSCFDCHAAGPIPSENAIRSYVDQFANRASPLYLKNKADALRVERTFLSGKFEEAISEHQRQYEKALRKVCGLTPEDFLKSYYRVIKWYGKPLDLSQVLLECGVTEEELREAEVRGLQDLNHKIPGRLGIMLATGDEISRANWESKGVDGQPGGFQQTMIALYGVTKVTDETKIVTEKLVNYVAVIPEQCKIYSNSTTVLGNVLPGTKVLTLGRQQNGWTWVTLEDNSAGWVLDKFIKRE